jgi:hypothetical protein
MRSGLPSGLFPAIGVHIRAWIVAPGFFGNSQTGWTTVPLSQFRFWEASFVREDGLFMFWGLLVATVFIALLDLRRQAARARM